MGCWGGKKTSVVLDEVDVVDGGESGHSSPSDTIGELLFRHAQAILIANHVLLPFPRITANTVVRYEHMRSRVWIANR
jgi:hypothetical protein